MKKLLIAALICLPLSAQAAAWFAQSKGGGQIIITDSECYFKGKAYKNLRQSYVRTTGGETLYGCWSYADTLVQVVYEDGTTYSYPVTVFDKLEAF